MRALKISQIIFFVSLAMFILYLITSSGQTPYDYFTRLAASFLEGKIYLSDNPPWLNELIPSEPGKYFVPYSPMPAIVALPFIALSKSFQQQWLAHIVGAGIVFVTMQTAFMITKDNKKTVWIGLLVGVGSIIWFLASTGSSWYFGQLVAALFLTLAINETVGKKRVFIVGLFVGAAYLSRAHTILGLPFFALLLLPKLTTMQVFVRNIFSTKMIKLALGVTPFFFFNVLYNYLRFGVFWDKGYVLIPGVLEEPWYTQGIFHPSYVSRHIKVMFLGLPVIKDAFPFAYPTWNGLAIWFTTPAFIFVFFNSLKEKVAALSWIAIIFISLPIVMHGTTGFAQFGYRFAVDFYPFLFLLLIKHLEKRNLRFYHWMVLSLCVLVNTWGVLWINEFKWISP